MPYFHLATQNSNAIDLGENSKKLFYDPVAVLLSRVYRVKNLFASFNEDLYISR